MFHFLDEMSCLFQLYSPFFYFSISRSHISTAFIPYNLKLVVF
eukprot:UN09756